jgi:hypothetical protein
MTAGGQVPASRPLAIRNVTVVDVTSGRAREAMTILIQGPRIVSVPPATVPPLDGSAVIDAQRSLRFPGCLSALADQPSPEVTR